MHEVVGGQFGETSAMIQYLFQEWNCRGPGKYRDMLLDIGTEEIGHVEMYAAMICRLLEGATADQQEAAANGDGVVGAVLGGSSTEDANLAAAANPQSWICSGLGAAPNDSTGFPPTARYVTSTGNLLADPRANLNAESQGRLRVRRLYQLTADAGVRDMLNFLIARDDMPQQQWPAATQELEAGGLDGPIVPNAFRRDKRYADAEYTYMGRPGPDGAGLEGRWANGPAADGQGESVTANPDRPRAEAPTLNPVAPRTYGTPPAPAMAAKVSS